MTDTTDERPTLLLWVDTETTGLDPRRDPILEVGMIATDADLNPLDDGFHTVVHWEGEPSDFIRGMHGPNGLLAECSHPSAPGMFAAALSARDYVEAHLDGDAHRLLPAGSTVRFDRDMLDSWMPGVLDGCSHRSLDVSALYEAIRMWNPAALPDTTALKTTNHRVMRCLADTLRYAAAYREAICRLA
ncbi:oligoribonuclease [Bifidobacterium myosotis]|uniref:DNA polymerase III n=1 Tax=Bifidobacterium myosotis TaxID=1630166 RepID=A0A5M9ZHX2_9BIFI|nr:exonuclease domain-containing protein [Bifidobacterium myosotis]KAA8826973.1 DNA polymerase III [Bifidobacterium myosotis]